MAMRKNGLPDHPGETFTFAAATLAASTPPDPPPDPPQWTIATTDDEPRAATAGAAAHDNLDYRLLRRIAEGGMGEVWEAEQRSLGRVIAVKRLKHPADSAERRFAEVEFRSESSVAASLEHPNILPVYDLGRDRDGALLLAMKRVHGDAWKDLLRAEFADTPVDLYLARHIPILVAVTQAVAFAHSRGVIHRDIKPAQVLVGQYGEVLLTDWGLAVHVDAPDDASPLLAGFAVATLDSAANPAGTPAFMAPEQTQSHGSNLGPWTDVYLLGGTLYYILTGQYPHDANNSAAAFQQARSGQVQPPSQRAPGRRVPADLERLCMQALSADRHARLASADAFLKGLQDYLSGAARKEQSRQLTADVEWQLAEHDTYPAYIAALAHLDEARQLWPDNPAIAALRETALRGSTRLAIHQGDLGFARLQGAALADNEENRALRVEIDQRRRQVTRRKSLLRAATAAVFALLAVIAGGALLFSHKMRTANTEIAQRAEEAEQALDIARARGDGAFGLITFVLEDLKQGMDEELTPERGITIDARNEIAHGIAGKVATPVVNYFTAAQSQAWPAPMRLEQARQKRLVGEVFTKLARREEARSLLQPALAEIESLAGSDSIDTADALVALAALEREAGRFEETEAMLRRALAIAEAGLPAGDPALAKHLNALANLFGTDRRNPARIEEASALYGRAAELLQHSDSASAAVALSMQGRTLDYIDRPQEAEVFHRRALQLWEREQAAEDPGVAMILDNLASSLGYQVRFLKHDDPARMAKTAEAEALQRRAIALLETRHGPDHPLVAEALSSLASIIDWRSRLDEVEALQRKVLAIYETAYGADNFRTGRKWLGLGFTLRNANRLREAEPALRRAIAILETSLGPDTLEIGWGTQFLGFVLKDTGRPREAKAQLERALRILTEQRGPEHMETVKAREALAEVEATLAG